MAELNRNTYRANQTNNRLIIAIALACILPILATAIVAVMPKPTPTYFEVQR